MSVSINGTTGLTFADSSTQNTGGYTGFRNRIINGAMMIDQRNAGASVTANNGVFGVDRFKYQATQTAKGSLQQSTIAPAGFVNSLLFTSSSAYSIAATDFFTHTQNIEGLNISDFAWGTANAAPVLLSFWVRSNLTGTFGGAIQNSDQDQNYPFSYTITASNTWEKKVVVIPGPTTGTWLTNTGRGINLLFGLGVGSTYSGSAGTWTTSNVFSATGATSIVGTSGATFYLTGVQLEKGSVATPFENRPYGMELQLCQRYYETGGQYQGTVLFSGYVTSGNNYYVTVYQKVNKRASPTIYLENANSNGFPNSASSLSYANLTEFRVSRLSNSSSAGGYFGDSWTASAEL